MREIDELARLFTRCCETHNCDPLNQVFAQLQHGVTATGAESFKYQLLSKTVLALRQNYKSLLWFCEYILFSKNLPSVTRILEATALPVRNQGRTRITKHEFELKKEHARKRGIAFHDVIKHHLTGRSYSCPDFLLPWIRSVEPVLSKLNYIRLSETPIFHPELLYCGKLDCVATYSGIECVIEWKTAERLEQSSLDEYIIQGVAYLDAINALHGLSLEHILIVVALPDQAAQTFFLDQQTLQPYRQIWYERVFVYKNPKQVIQNPDGSDFEIVSPIYQVNSVLPPLIRYQGANFNHNRRYSSSSLTIDEKYSFPNEDNFEEEVTIRYYTEDSIRLYLQEIGRIRLLRADEEIELAHKIADLLELERIRARMADKLDREPLDGEWAEEIKMPLSQFRHRLHLGRRAKDKMVQSNLRLVVSIAKKYMNRGLSFQDLIQEGSLGLIRAAEKFDHEKGYKFSTYACWWIRQAIIHAIDDQCRIIRLPTHLSETIGRVRKAIKLLSREMGREPTEEEVAYRLGTTIEKLQLILKSDCLVVSLDDPIEAKEDPWSGEQIDQDFSCLGDHLTAEDEYFEELRSSNLLREDLEGILSILSIREKDVLRLRYGLDDGRMKTLEEIGQIFDTTRERICQIEAKALRKLRHPDRNTVLKEYIC